MNFLCEEHSQHLFEFAFNVHTFWAEGTVVRAFPCVSVKVLSQVGRLLEPGWDQGWERGEGAHAKDENERVHARDEEVREFMQICFLRNFFAKRLLQALHEIETEYIVLLLPVQTENIYILRLLMTLVQFNAFLLLRR